MTVLAVQQQGWFLATETVWPAELIFIYAVLLPDPLYKKFASLCFVVVVVHSLSYVLLVVYPWTVAPQTPLSMGCPRQESWCGISFPSSGDLPDAGIKPVSPASASRFFTTEPLESPVFALGHKIFALLSTSMVSCHSIIGIRTPRKVLIFALESDRLVFECQLWYKLWSWTNKLTSWCFRYLLCNQRI